LVGGCVKTPLSIELKKRKGQRRGRNQKKEKGGPSEGNRKSSGFRVVETQFFQGGG